MNFKKNRKCFHFVIQGFFIFTICTLLDESLSASPALPNINTNNVVVVTNAAYGAIGDGVTTNTAAIQNAINAAAAGGTTNGAAGGTVEIPPGIYLSGPLTLGKSVNLQIDAGAILRMLPFGQYPVTWFTNGGTNIYFTAQNFISGSSLTDIEISGSGAIDGQGLPWWPWANTNNAVRPIMIYLNSCNRELIQNVTLSNSPMFHIAIGGNAGNSTVQGVTVLAPSSTAIPPSHNTDACDVSGTNILVQNCNISTGDDDFTCGGGTHDVLLTNNVYGNGHGISIGSYTSGGVSNITVINCTMNGTLNGIRIKSDNDRGGLVQNISYYNISMTNVDFPIQIYAYYNEIGTPSSVSANYAATQAVAAVTSLTPAYRNITFSNITATAVSGYPVGIIWARTEMPATNIVFQKINLTGYKNFCLYNVSGAQFIDPAINLPAGVTNFAMFDSQVVITNSAPTNTLFTFDGLTTNGYGNSFSFYNAQASLKNTNVLDDGPLSLSASTLTVSNNLTLFPTTLVNFTLGTNTTRLAVAGNLTLGGTNNISAGNGFTNGTYTLMTYSGAISGSPPTLGSIPLGSSCVFDTSTAGLVNLIVSSNSTPVPSAPTNLVASATNQLVTLTWSPSATATSYNVKRATTSGGSYTTLSNVAVTNYSDTSVANGTTYYYVVSAINAGGEGTNSAEVNATPQATQTTTISGNNFNDLFSNSTINSASPSAPTTTGSSYEIISSKSWNPSPGISSGHLQFGIGTTTSGGIEAQALFAGTPVALKTNGDTISLVVTFTNTSGLLTESGAMGFGLYNSGQNYPVPGGLNSTATTNVSGNATGNAQTWSGYVGQLAFTGSSSQIMTRAPQNGTANNNQDLVTSGSGSSSYVNPAAATVGSATSAQSVTLVAGNPYTEVLTLTLTATNKIAVTNQLYSGTGTNGTLLSQFGGVASGSTFMTNSFDAFAIGWRTTSSASATAIDINQIAVNFTLTTALTTPPAPTNLVAQATNLAINLQWNSVLGATNYNLKRGTTSGGPYPTIFSALTATNYLDANVTNTVNYFYVVTAVGAGGESTNSIQASATPLPSNQPTNFVMQTGGGQLQLSWPLDHIGWRLQIQTNNFGAGLGTNWTDVPNGNMTNQYIVPVNAGNGSVFLRLTYP